MKTEIYKADSRGHVDHGWLTSYHTFSFANYHNPERMNFGAMRVLNDDRVAPGRGFDTHRHLNMEIVSIPLSGDLEHKDSMGNETIIREGDIQVMSAGTGINHSEYNKNDDQEVKFLQIWIMPNARPVAPRYDQMRINENGVKNEFVQILSPDKDDEGVWIYQKAWFHIGEFTEETTAIYTLKNENDGLFVFVLEGTIQIAGEILRKRDAIGISDITEAEISAQSGSKVLLIEVPMDF
ncbi:pirin family protein [Dokdonia sinensis]|uniref:Pirin family protein n=1 Tax=Dokdonia sinensis TaxID=2479847 RepID=A0A3M0FYV2_9FLAO|nr:pirin family protein [Dokdonia sinensis]RMB57645.1 pirin family protein [Dokdonia sinensis]